MQKERDLPAPFALLSFEYLLHFSARYSIIILALSESPNVLM